MGDVLVFSGQVMRSSDKVARAGSGISLISFILPLFLSNLLRGSRRPTDQSLFHATYPEPNTPTQSTLTYPKQAHRLQSTRRGLHLTF